MATIFAILIIIVGTIWLLTKFKVGRVLLSLVALALVALVGWIIYKKSKKKEKDA